MGKFVFVEFFYVQKQKLYFSTNFKYFFGRFTFETRNDWQKTFSPSMFFFKFTWVLFSSKINFFVNISLSHSWPITILPFFLFLLSRKLCRWIQCYNRRIWSWTKHFRIVFFHLRISLHVRISKADTRLEFSGAGADLARPRSALPRLARVLPSDPTPPKKKQKFSKCFLLFFKDLYW